MNSATLSPHGDEPVGSRYEIDFRAGGKGQEFLIAGWSFPELEYTWTLGQKSIIRLPRADTSKDYSLKFRAGPMIREGLVNLQRLYIEVNGKIVTRLILRAPTQHEIFIPAETIGDAAAIEIVLHLPDAQAPSALGGSGDSRDLGVWMSSLLFQAVAIPPLPARATAGALDKAILMDLQSLGENCELGFVQRFNGAEPFGLFRWASTPLANLLQALDAHFEGLGRAESIAIEVDAASEYQILDRRYGFRNHSFAFQSAGAKKEDILKRELIRLPFMARLLIEDLEQATKLFCYHDAGRSGADRIEHLVAALGGYGPNWLLWVCPASRPEQVGSAERIGDRLIRGYIDRFQPIHNVRQPSLDAWMSAIRAAHALWRSGRTPSGPVSA